MRACLLTCIFLLLMSVSAHGEFYKWTDRDGKVHFTDNISGIPPEYRHQVEGRSSAPPSRQSTPQTSSRGASPRPSAGDMPTSKHYTVPLLRVGNALFVDVVLNGFLQSRLLVDTGAELTVISMALAKQLALNLDEAATVPLQSVSGVFLAPLTKVKSITVGGVTIRDVEVVVHDIAQGSSGGLLGMSFLDNFQVTMHAAEGSMTLTTLTGIPGQTLYGGHPEDWWRRKFRFYRRQVALLEAYLSKQSAPRLAKTLRYFQAELASLERKASQASVPRHWRY
jgi:clan AA aspartic protease (TIGR02281 family)